MDYIKVSLTDVKVFWNLFYISQQHSLFSNFQSLQHLSTLIDNSINHPRGLHFFSILHLYPLSSFSWPVWFCLSLLTKTVTIQYHRYRMLFILELVITSGGTSSTLKGRGRAVVVDEMSPHCYAGWIQEEKLLTPPFHSSNIFCMMCSYNVNNTAEMMLPRHTLL